MMETMREGRMPLLLCVNLSRCQVGDELMGLLGEAVRGGFLREVKELYLSGNRFREVGLGAFFHAVRETPAALPAVEILDLSSNAVGEGVGLLETALVSGKLQTLKELRLATCRLTDESMRMLGDAFRAHRTQSLSSLCLSENEPLTETGLSKFLEALSPQSLPKLQAFSLVGCPSLGPVRVWTLVLQAREKFGKLRSLTSLLKQTERSLKLK
mmetsp:Transcript_48005/g.94792  ORF Transcript_48005/g.94792 Transcript_48005/m.94792 type:complete len:213 (+) Transcript_48005:3-641(+)